MQKFAAIVDFIKNLYPNKDFIPLHEPYFSGNEKKYVVETIDSTFVSSVGQFVDDFEKKLTEYTGSKYAVATVNGTSALHMALKIAGVKENDEVITQAFSFIATSNAIRYLNANPVYLDIDKSTLGLSYAALKKFLEENVELDNDVAINKFTKNKVTACVPMHTFGFPCEIDLIAKLCSQYKITLVEDAAESIGSFYKQKHTGTFGRLGIFSFNGNKTITCGGGGAIITNDETLAKRAKHLTTQAKLPHSWEFIHDEVGYNYRMPNLNAALACAQLEKLNNIVEEKRKLAGIYSKFFSGVDIPFYLEKEDAKTNYWLNSILLKDKSQRNEFLQYTNSKGVMTRPVWTLLNELKMFANCQTDQLKVSKWISDRIVNIPSSVRK